MQRPSQASATATTGSGRPEVAVLRGGEGTTLATYRAPRARLTSTSSGPVWECGYYDVGPIGPYGPGINSAGGIVTPQDGVSYWLVCRAEDQVVYQQLVLWDPTNPFAGLAAGDRAAEEARNALPLPDPTLRTAPPETAAQLVGVPTWLWLDDPWVPRTAVATLGGVTATVTATPAEVRWDAGDGSAPVTCADAGTPFDPAAPDRVPTCAHTYTRRSTAEGDGTFALTATVTWTVAWQATNGDGGTLEPLTRVATVPVVVHEAQARIG